MKLRNGLAAPALILVAASSHYFSHRGHHLVARKKVGRIDELALDDHPLSAEEVRRHDAPLIPGGRPSRP